MKISIERNIPIDALRGFAIFLMVISNSYSYIFENSPSILIRLLLSSAAPIFIFLSGYTFQLSIEKSKAKTDFIKRIFQIYLVAVLIDVCVWQIYPMQNFDVLYLISISMIGMLLLNNFSSNIKLILFLLLIPITFLVRLIFQYRFQIVELHLEPIDFKILTKYYGIDFIRRIHIDGWFPLLPWFSIALLGNIVKQKILFVKKNANLFGLIGIVLIIISIYFYFDNYNDINQIRDGYVEIFYPVDKLFLVNLFGVLGVVLFIITRNSLYYFSLFRFQIIGKYSLFFYFYHSVIISAFFKNYFDDTYKINYWCGITALILFWCSILILAHLLEKYKSTIVGNNILKKMLFVIGI